MVIMVECAYPPCKNKFEPVAQGTAREKKYCSSTCRIQHNRDKLSDELKNKREIVECARDGCTNTFEKVGRKKYCSRVCERQQSNAVRNIHNVANPSKPPTPDEQVKLQELAKIERKVRDDVGRTRILAEMLDESVAKVNAKDIKPYKVKRKPSRDPETMVVLRSDLHPGIVTPSYDLDVFHRRMELYIEKIVLIRDIISQTIPLEKIVVINLGDMVSGQGIFANQAWKSQTHVLNQIYHECAPDIIAQDMTLCEYFPVVEEEYIPGNHGRTGKEHPDEVNFDNILSWDIFRRFEFVDQVKVDYTWGHFKFIDIYGWRFLATHGDLVRSWMNIPFYGLVNKGMRWKGSMSPSRKDVQKAIMQTVRDSSLSAEEKVSAIQHITSTWHYMVHGHFHVPFNFPWNDFEIIGNGTLVSDDDFGLEQLGMASTPAQQVFGVHPEHGVTWRYTLNLE